MSEQNPPIDPASLDSLDAIADCLADAFEDGDGAIIGAALKAVSQAPGLGALAAAVGVPREQLGAALASGEFDLDLTLEIMKVVDLHMGGGRSGD
jgi:probable addiction module antidote protein